MSQSPPVLAVPLSPFQMSGQVEGSQTDLSDVGVLNQTQGRVGSGLYQGAPGATKPCFEDLFEQVRSPPFKTDLEVYETNTCANLADSPQSPRPSPRPSPAQSVGQPSRRSLVVQGGRAIPSIEQDERDLEASGATMHKRGRPPRLQRCAQRAQRID